MVRYFHHRMCNRFTESQNRAGLKIRQESLQGSREINGYTHVGQQTDAVVVGLLAKSKKVYEQALEYPLGHIPGDQ
jgi:hypothetical protein